MRKPRLAGAFLLPVALAVSAVCTAREPFTVRDSIEMTRLAEPNLQAYGYLALEFNVSPGGEYLTAITKKGNIDNETVDYSLWLFPLHEVEAFVIGDGRSAWPGRVIARFSSSTNRPAIQKVRWLADGPTLMFVAENPSGQPQVFSVDPGSGEMRQWTYDPEGVIDFAAGAGEGGLLVLVPADDEAERLRRQKYGYVHDFEPVWTLMNEGRDIISDIYPHGVFVARTGGGETVTVDLAPQTLVNPVMSVSPSGQWAIVPRRMPVIPDHWYELDWGLLSDMIAGMREEGVTILWMTQLMLLDMQTGETRPLLDSPNGLTSVIRWSPDSRRVVVSDQFVPFESGDTETGGKHATIEIEVESGSLEIVALGEHNSLDADSALTTVTLGSRFGPPVTVFRGESGWTPIEGGEQDEDDGPRLSFSLALEMNEPPEIVATHSPSGKSRKITDFNPQLRDLAIGVVESFDWESGGRTWMGGLLRPIGFEEGRRYPLVVQTHGFHEWEFLVDGPRGMSAAMAARALANEGFVVLQAPDGPRESLQLPKEAEEVSASYIDAVRVLDGMGLIDPERVGITGFSRTGFYVQHALTMGDFEFAAAVVADVSDFGWWMYMTGYGFGGFQRDYERMLDGAPVGDGVTSWIERNPVFNLEEMTTPLRIESHQIPSYWDTYILLRKLGRPVEMIVLPEASHNPERPWERLESQQGAVDWFAFWLKDEENNDPARADQYNRWRKLRELQNGTAKVSAPGTS